jgi:hypothetical protein
LPSTPVLSTDTLAVYVQPLASTKAIVTINPLSVLNILYPSLFPTAVLACPEVERYGLCLRSGMTIQKLQRNCRTKTGAKWNQNKTEYVNKKRPINSTI